MSAATSDSPAFVVLFPMPRLNAIYGLRSDSGKKLAVGELPFILDLIHERYPHTLLKFITLAR